MTRFKILMTSICLPSSVAITFKDARENQSTTAGEDYVVKCVVAANPPPTIGKTTPRRVFRLKNLISNFAPQTGITKAIPLDLLVAS